jgi:PPOX class probable F420-dependent enzyme
MYKLAGMDFKDEKYISVATFRKSGDPVATATWVVPLSDDRLGFWTSSTSGKAKRLRNNPRVTIQPSDGRGKVKAGSEASAGTVELVESGPEFDSIQAQVRAKYGVMVGISRFFNTLGHLGKGKQPYGDVGVVITLDDSGE